MKTTQKSFIVEYKFNTVKSGINATIYGNLLFFLFFWIINSGNISNHPFAQFSLLSAILIYLSKSITDLKNSKTNLFFLLMYLSIVFVEFIKFGIPQPTLSSIHMSKGILLDLFIHLGPYIYTGVRIMMIIPLINIFLASKGFDE